MKYNGFPVQCIASLVCQKCRGDIRSPENTQFINNGQIECIKCGESYHIIDGILRLIPLQTLDATRESEMKMRDQQAEKYDKRLDKRYHKEVASTCKAIGSTKGMRILEHGSGTGRLTVEYAKMAECVISCDFSIVSLEVQRGKLVETNIGLVHADATQIITREEYFDLVIATQFYEHIPRKELRDQFLKNTQETLKRGGKFISTTYHYDLRMRMRGAPQEGMHSGETFFHYYTVGELRHEFSRFFTQQQITPIDITLPFEERLRLPSTIRGSISRISERIPGVNLFGHLLLCVFVRN